MSIIHRLTSSWGFILTLEALLDGDESRVEEDLTGPDRWRTEVRDDHRPRRTVSKEVKGSRVG